MMYSVEDRKIRNWIIIGVIIAAILPRLWLALSSAQIPSYDAAGYDNRAVSIVEGRGFSIGGRPTSFKEPFYSFFLALVYRLFGRSYTIVRVIQAVLGAFTCALVFLITRMIFDTRTGLISALLVCFNPALIASTEHLYTENFFTFLLSVIMYLICRQMRENGIASLIFIGFMMGIAALTRSMLFFFPVVLLLFAGKRLFSYSANRRKSIFCSVLLLLVFVCTILPWTVRNWRIHRRFVPISTNTGINLYSSYVPKDGKLYGFTTVNETTKKAKELYMTEVDRSNYLVCETLRYIRNNPLTVLKLEVLKVAYFWSPFDWEVIGYGVYNCMYGFIIPFFIFGIAVTRKRLRDLSPLYLPILYAFGIALMTYGSPRFRLPFEPYISIVAAVGILHFVGAFSRKFFPILATVFYFTVNMFLAINSYQAKIVARTIFERIGLW